MAVPLMPKATAVWLVENTSLTFEQIADFCGQHPLEIQAIADGEVANQMQGLDPVANGQTTAEEIARCQADPQARLKLSPQALPPQLFRHKGPRYTPIAKRQDKPDAIAFLVKTYPELSEAQISKLIGTTKPTIAAVRDRIGPVASFKTALVVAGLPKTRSGKILRGTMRKIADGEDYLMPATIDDPAVLGEIDETLARAGYARVRIA